MIPFLGIALSKVLLFLFCKVHYTKLQSYNPLVTEPQSVDMDTNLAEISNE